MASQGSYFKGWSSIGPSTTQPKSAYGNSYVSIIIGQVLDVYYELDNYSKDTPGLIRVKIVNLNSDQPDDGLNTFAYPADYSMIKFPLPGELVFLTVAPKDEQSEGIVSKVYYYTTVLTSTKSITYNSNPFYLDYKRSSETTVLGLLDSIFQGESPKKRFEVRLDDVSKFIKKDVVIERPALRPFEGDFIIQSRFGSSMRLGSTSAIADNPWSLYGGMAGNPITIFSVRKKLPTTDAEILNDRLTLDDVISGLANLAYNDKQLESVIEDVNADDATIALCTTQVLNAKLSTSNELLSMKYIYNVKDINEDLLSDTSFVPGILKPPPAVILTGGIGGGGVVSGDGSGGIGAGGSVNPKGEITYPADSQPSITQANICVGDSQTPYVSRNSKKAKVIGSAEQKNLHLGGKTLSWLITAIGTRQISPAVKNVVVCIGTNGGFSDSDSAITKLFTALKLKFPNANYLIVQGSWGWGGNAELTEKFVRDYYKKYKTIGGNRVTIIEPPIGPYEPHGQEYQTKDGKASKGKTDPNNKIPLQGTAVSYPAIGAAIDGLII